MIHRALSLWCLLAFQSLEVYESAEGRTATNGQSQVLLLPAGYLNHIAHYIHHNLILNLLVCLFRPLNPVRLPPSPDSLINLFPCHPIPNKHKRHPQLCLHIAIACFIVKEQHILISNPARLVDPRKVLCLRRREDLDVLKVVKSPRCLSFVR